MKTVSLVSSRYQHPYVLLDTRSISKQLCPKWPHTFGGTEVESNFHSQGRNRFSGTIKSVRIGISFPVRSRAKERRDIALCHLAQSLAFNCWTGCPEIPKCIWHGTWDVYSIVSRKSKCCTASSSAKEQGGEIHSLTVALHLFKF